jgi:hypothetical protein
MIRQEIRISIALIIVFSLLTMPSGAVSLPESYRGEVAALDPVHQTMSMSIDAMYECNPAGVTMVCTWVAANRTTLAGTVPDPAVFSVVKVSDTIEASQVMEDTRQWMSIARVIPAHGTYLATDLIGDPAFLQTSLVGGNQIFYSLTPDCFQCKDSVCQAQSATITVNQSGTTVFGATLRPGEEGELMEKDPDSLVHLTFIGGETLSAGCPSKELPLLSNVQLKRVFIINIDLDNENRAVMTQTLKSMPLPLHVNTSVISDTEKSTVVSSNITPTVNTSLTSDIQKTPGMSPSVPFPERSPQVGDKQPSPAVSSSFVLTILIVTGVFFAFRKK